MTRCESDLKSSGLGRRWRQLGPVGGGESCALGRRPSSSLSSLDTLPESRSLLGLLVPVVVPGEKEVPERSSRPNRHLYLSNGAALEADCTGPLRAAW